MLDMFDIPVESKLCFTNEFFLADFAPEKEFCRWVRCPSRFFRAGKRCDGHSPCSATWPFQLSFAVHFLFVLGPCQMRSITIIPCYLDELGYVGFDKFLPVMCSATYIHHASKVNYRFQANHCRLQLLGFSRIAVPCFALVRQGGKVALRPLETFIPPAQRRHILANQEYERAIMLKIRSSLESKVSTP